MIGNSYTDGRNLRDFKAKILVCIIQVATDINAHISAIAYSLCFFFSTANNLSLSMNKYVEKIDSKSIYLTFSGAHLQLLKSIGFFILFFC